MKRASCGFSFYLLLCDIDYLSIAEVLASARVCGGSITVTGMFSFRLWCRAISARRSSCALSSSCGFTRISIVKFGVFDCSPWC